MLNLFRFKICNFMQLPEFCTRDSSLIVKEIFGVTEYWLFLLCILFHCKSALFTTTFIDIIVLLSVRMQTLFAFTHFPKQMPLNQPRRWSMILAPRVTMIDSFKCLKMQCKTLKFKASWIKFTNLFFPCALSSFPGYWTSKSTDLMEDIPKGKGQRRDQILYSSFGMTTCPVRATKETVTAISCGFTTANYLLNCL